MSVSGALSGTVLDPSGQVVPAANVTLTSSKTNAVLRTTTNATGVFSFIAVPPESYTLKVEHAGFKGAERTDVVVAANERSSIGDIQLQIGAVSDTISVEAKVQGVQTDSSEHSDVITGQQIDTLTARGRDVVSMLRTIPGVQYQADQDSVGEVTVPPRPISAAPPRTATFSPWTASSATTKALPVCSPASPRSMPSAR